MMKKLHIIGILAMLGGAPIGAVPLEERLCDAITEQNSLKVNQVLRRFLRERKGISERRAIIFNLAQFADDIGEKKESHVSIFGNKKDFGMCFLGTLIGAFGLMYFCHSCYESYENYLEYGLSGVLFHDDIALAYHSSVSVPPLLFGAYFAYNGWTCSMQQEALMQAHAIQDSLDEKLEELMR